MTDRLGHKQTAAMFALMVIAREVSNPELRDIVGFVLDGKERRQLNELDLVASEKRGRAFVHELTKQGWAWCGQEMLAGEPPAPRGSLSNALYVILGGLDKQLRQRSMRLADFFAPNGTPSVDDVESRIRIAYRKLARAPRDWVGLVDLRPLLGGVPSEEVDVVLKELSRSGEAHLVPEDNRKVLTKADHEAAIRIGGEDNHLLSIETL